jgi:uncharacterized protein DUF6265
MPRRAVVLAAILCCALPRDARAQHARTLVQQLSWITGCWRQSTGGGTRVIDEQWMSPRGGTMLGMSRTVRGDSLLEFEHLQILERSGRLVYHAEPSGQPPADFVASTVSDTLVVFENPEHDFPQRIIYRRRGTDTLVARIEGPRNGQTRGIDFPYMRVSCP